MSLIPARYAGQLVKAALVQTGSGVVEEIMDRNDAMRIGTGAFQRSVFRPRGHRAVCPLVSQF